MNELHAATVKIQSLQRGRMERKKFLKIKQANEEIQKGIEMMFNLYNLFAKKNDGKITTFGCFCLNE